MWLSCFFFFSSRRRHTRLQGDWSSDVCSSDLFNAAVALRRPASDFAGHADSVTFCLSKGLGAPVGSVICGSRDLIARARRMRKMIGGGMRQAGVIAAAGIVALERMVDPLAEDHPHTPPPPGGGGETPGAPGHLGNGP